MYENIEKTVIAKEAKEVEITENTLAFTKNQFLRELQRSMNDDEAQTLKNQLINVSRTHLDNLNRLNVEWSDFADIRLMDIERTHLPNRSPRSMPGDGSELGPDQFKVVQVSDNKGDYQTN